MHAITTKYIGPTNTKGARIKATAGAGSITVTYDYDGSAEDAHKIAAYALVKKMEWDGKLTTGVLHNGDYVHVFTK